MSEALKPSVALLCKLGSLAVHSDEMLSPLGHDFDRIALENLLRDPEVVSWIAEMQKLAMVPVKRTAEDLRKTAIRAAKGGKP